MLIPELRVAGRRAKADELQQLEDSLRVLRVVGSDKKRRAGAEDEDAAIPDDLLVWSAPPSHLFFECLVGFSGDYVRGC